MLDDHEWPTISCKIIHPKKDGSWQDRRSATSSWGCGRFPELAIKHESNTMKPLRVINVIPSLADVSSGPSYSVLRLCESLREAGIELTVAALDSPSHWEMPVWVKGDFPAPLVPVGLAEVCPWRIGSTQRLRLGTST